MAQAPETLVTDRMREMQGVWTEPVSSFPVDRADIKRWAISTYWPERPPPIYWDEEYAKTTRWGGIIAPRDLNPFAWPIERPERLDPWAIDSILPRPNEDDGGVTGGGVGNRGMNGGQTDTLGVAMRPGDVITQRTRLVDWNERQTRLGLTMFTRAEHEWTNQRGELVKRRINTLIRY